MRSIRFTDSNWERFTTHAKKTTWRTHQLKNGIYEWVKGSYYHTEKTGSFLQIEFLKSKTFSELAEQDAKDDGFETLVDFRAELLRLNKLIRKGSVLYCHSAKVLIEI